MLSEGIENYPYETVYEENKKETITYKEKKANLWTIL